MTAQFEREFDVIVIGAGAVGENVADRVVRRRPDRSADRGGTGGRRVLLLGLHALQGAAAAGHRTPRRTDRPRRPGSRHPDPGRGRRAQTPRLLHLQLAGRQPGQVGRGHRDRADPRPRLDHRPRGTSKWPGWTATATRSRRGTPSWWPRGPPPTQPPVEGLADVEYWTTREATSAREVPARLAVLGGGVAGIELAQAYARLGASVTLVARGGLLGVFPERGRGAGRRRPARRRRRPPPAHRNRGASARTTTAPSPWCSTAAPQRAKDGPGAGPPTARPRRHVTADKLLVTTGRHPALEGLGLDSVGLAAAEGKALRLSTDSTGLVPAARRTSAGPWLYAAGDAAGRPC